MKEATLQIIQLPNVLQKQNIQKANLHSPIVFACNVNNGPKNITKIQRNQ